MSTTEFAARPVRHEDGVAVLELSGDVSAAAEAGLQGAYGEVAAEPVVVLDFAAVDYINSTGIALIVGILAEARKSGQEVRARGSRRALPGDLPHHAALGLHDHPRRGGSGMTQDTAAMEVHARRRHAGRDHGARRRHGSLGGRADGRLHASQRKARHGPSCSTSPGSST